MTIFSRSHILKKTQGEINFNSIFYLAQYIQNIIISTHNQCLNVINEIFHIEFFALTLRKLVCSYSIFSFDLAHFKLTATCGCVAKSHRGGQHGARSLFSEALFSETFNTCWSHNSRKFVAITAFLCICGVFVTYSLLLVTQIPNLKIIFWCLPLFSHCPHLIDLWFFLEIFLPGFTAKRSPVPIHLHHYRNDCSKKPFFSWSSQPQKLWMVPFCLQEDPHSTAWPSGPSTNSPPALRVTPTCSNAPVLSRDRLTEPRESSSAFLPLFLVLSHFSKQNYQHRTTITDSRVSKKEINWISLIDNTWYSSWS